MLKDFAWNYFEKTGSIEAFLAYNQLQDTKTGDEKRDDDASQGTYNQRNQCR